jgi:hypothetical protein
MLTYQCQDDCVDATAPITLGELFNVKFLGVAKEVAAKPQDRYSNPAQPHPFTRVFGTLMVKSLDVIGEPPLKHIHIISNPEAGVLLEITKVFPALPPCPELLANEVLLVRLYKL